jgi:hypothetical protein
MSPMTSCQVHTHITPGTKGLPHILHDWPGAQGVSSVLLELSSTVASAQWSQQLAWWITSPGPVTSGEIHKLAMSGFHGQGLLSTTTRPLALSTSLET